MGESDVAPPIRLLAVMSVAQEADTAVVVGTAEPGEGWAADDGDGAVSVLVARAGFVDRGPAGRRSGRRPFAQLLVPSFGCVTWPW